MNENWQHIYSTSQAHIAEIVKAVLEDHEVTAVVISKKDSFYHFGDIEVYVHTDNVIKAKQIIKKGNFE